MWQIQRRERSEQIDVRISFVGLRARRPFGGVPTSSSMGRARTFFAVWVVPTWPIVLTSTQTLIYRRTSHIWCAFLCCPVMFLFYPRDASRPRFHLCALRFHVAVIGRSKEILSKKRYHPTPPTMTPVPAQNMWRSIKDVRTRRPPHFGHRRTTTIAIYFFHGLKMFFRVLIQTCGLANRSRGLKLHLDGPIDHRINKKIEPIYLGYWNVRLQNRHRHLKKTDLIMENIWQCLSAGQCFWKVWWLRACMIDFLCCVPWGNQCPRWLGGQVICHMISSQCQGVWQFHVYLVIYIVFLILG